MLVLDEISEQLWPGIPVLLVLRVADASHLDDELFSVRCAVDQLDSFGHSSDE